MVSRTWQAVSSRYRAMEPPTHVSARSGGLTPSPHAARSRRPSSWRPSLRMLVVAAAVTIVVGMAVAVASIVANQLRQTATAAALHSVETIVRGYVDPSIGQAGLELSSQADPAITDQLDRIVASGDILSI